MTPDDGLTPLEALREAATPGRWFERLAANQLEATQLSGGRWVILADLSPTREDVLVAECPPTRNVAQMPHSATRGADERASKANAALIVAAVNSLPKLIAEIRRLRAQLAQAEDRGAEAMRERAAAVAEDRAPVVQRMASDLLARLTATHFDDRCMRCGDARSASDGQFCERGHYMPPDATPADASEAPGHTDLMLGPDEIDAFLARIPPDELERDLSPRPQEGE